MLVFYYFKVICDHKDTNSYYYCILCLCYPAPIAIMLIIAKVPIAIMLIFYNFKVLCDHKDTNILLLYFMF